MCPRRLHCDGGGNSSLNVMKLKFHLPSSEATQIFNEGMHNLYSSSDVVRMSKSKDEMGGGIQYAWDC
jgi:hypothetical protein